MLKEIGILSLVFLCVDKDMWKRDILVLVSIKILNFRDFTSRNLPRKNMYTGKIYFNHSPTKRHLSVWDF